MIEFVNNFEGPRWWHEEDDWSLRPNGYYFKSQDGRSYCGPYETPEAAEEAQARYEDHYP